MWKHQPLGPFSPCVGTQDQEVHHICPLLAGFGGTNVRLIASRSQTSAVGGDPRLQGNRWKASPPPPHPRGGEEAAGGGEEQLTHLGADGSLQRYPLVVICICVL